MEKCRKLAGFMAVLILVFALALGPGLHGMARAASEDVAIFYDDLSQYGQWVEYENYGPVWRPSQVPEDWRPYTNGRWVPTDDGTVFESEEPWGWATYHYGNWMPTEGYGWVWVPGSTWYPSTVEWRSSPESDPIDSSYIGWAPTPPPNYVPPPAYAPPSYYPGAPVIDALAAPLWVFARAASFLVGFGQPYSPNYSYINSGILVPPAYVPVFYTRTIIIPRYVTPAYYPPAFIGVHRYGVGAYNMGPSVAYISRVTNIHQTVINRTIHNNSIHLNRFHSVLPPDRVLRRGAYIRNTLPPALIQGKPLPPPQPVSNFGLAQANLNKPNFLPPPQGLPRIQAQIPRVKPVAVTLGRNLPGTTLPARATMPLTPQMTQQIHQLPPNQQVVPGKSQPFTPAVGSQAGTEAEKGRIQPQPGKFRPPVPVRPGSEQAVVPGQPQQISPKSSSPSGYKPSQAGPGYVRPGIPPSSQPRPGEFHRQTVPSSPPGGTIPPAASAPGATRPGTVSPQPGAKILIPEQQRQRDQERLRRQQVQQQQQRQRQIQSQEQSQPQQQMRIQQQQQQHERQRQMQMQQQRQQFDRARQQQMQQQRQVQIQQQRQLQERQRQLQTRPQPQAVPRMQNPPPRPQPQPVARPQPQSQSQQQQKRQGRGNKDQEHQ